MSQSDKLIVLTEVERRLANIGTVDEAKGIRDQAEAVRVYAKSAGLGLAIQNRAASVKILAERRAGELLKAMEKHDGGRPGKTGNKTLPVSTLSEMGVDKMQSHRWQTMSKVPEARVRELEVERTAAGEELTSQGIYTLARDGVHFASQTDEWATPQALFDLLDSEFHFTLDVCATKQNAKCAQFFSRDGLSQPWEGACWMNPPYGDAIGDWVAKAHESGEAGATVVCLVPARTDTAWWWDHARFGEVRFLRGRLRFGGATTGAPFPSAVTIFGRPAAVVWWEAWRG